jgi:hypothetical protein
MTLTASQIEKKLQRLDELEKKVQVVQDIEDIKALMARYIHNLLVVNWDGVFDCFAEDARVDIAYTGLRTGKPQIIKLFKEEIGNRHIGKEHFFAVQPIISVDGDNAKGTWVVYFMMTESTIVPTMVWQQGPYNCEYKRVNGEWKISYLWWRQRVGVKPANLANRYKVKDDFHT